MLRILLTVSVQAILLFPAMSQTRIYIGISSWSQFMVTNPSGERMGLEPSPLWRTIREIRDAGYGLNWNGGDIPMYQFEIIDQTPRADGTYTIELIGDSTGTAWLNVEVLCHQVHVNVQEPYFDLEKIPLQRDSVTTYLFTYHGAIGSPVSLTKVVTARTLGRDVFAMLGLHWISEKSTAAKYLRLIADYSHQLRIGGRKGAHSSLRTLLGAVTADSGTGLTKDAYACLRADIETLMQR
jgi:hypothetical protein